MVCPSRGLPLSQVMCRQVQSCWLLWKSMDEIRVYYLYLLVQYMWQDLHDIENCPRILSSSWFCIIILLVELACIFYRCTELILKCVKVLVCDLALLSITISNVVVYWLSPIYVVVIPHLYSLCGYVPGASDPHGSVIVPVRWEISYVPITCSMETMYVPVHAL